MPEKVARYGSWKSPITSEMIASGTTRFTGVVLSREDIYWEEIRSAEGGRYVIVRRSLDGRIVDITPPAFNARTLVHEYGGGSFLVDGDTVYFSNYADQRLYRQRPGSEPRPITPEAKLRYADGIFDHRRARIICVREDHSQPGREAVNALVAIPGEGGEGEVLVSGNDFYSSPRLSPDGSLLAWLTWNHPNMPWNSTELWVAGVEEDGSLSGAELVAGGSGESIVQPEFSPGGTLYFGSDRTGWWNLYRWTNRRIEPMCRMEAEFGEPQWMFGRTTYAFESARRIICTYCRKGTWYLAGLDTETGELKEIQTPYTSIYFVRAAPGKAVFLGGSPAEATSVVQLDLATGKSEVLRRSGVETLDADYLSIPGAIEFPTEHGLKANAFFYAPENRDYAAPDDEKPPLLVISHGGPTSATSSTLSMMIQYWTSRGIAVVDVNYGGSTGYGRDYMQRLKRQWGVVDVDDCVNAVRYLIERGEVDGNRLAIRGGSAGGYTTLSALAFRDVFKAGASYYGLSELEIFVKDTHKFESRYLEWLIGSYEKEKELYRQRSPINYIDQLSCPVIFFQGLEDKIVPPNQAELMVQALEKKGVPVAYIPFEGEQHGFRAAGAIKRSLDAELYFYSKVFGFELAEPVEPVEIKNL
jgi:dipeptidyl aminopeptidase/acylaminoacyl peptidase